VPMNLRGDEREPTRIWVTDPRAIRALAHPARQQILLRLFTEGPATATECAALTRLTPSACSYHLRHLSKYGFVEPEPVENADRRERTWRPVSQEVTIDVDDNPSLPELRAMVALHRGMVVSAAAAAQAWVDTAIDDPLEWFHAAGFSQRVLRLTAEELTELRRNIFELMKPFLHRARDEVVEGARLVDSATFLTPRG